MLFVHNVIARVINVFTDEVHGRVERLLACPFAMRIIKDVLLSECSEGTYCIV